MKNGKHEPERYQIRGQPEVYDDLVQVLQLVRMFGSGAEVIRLPDGVVMAVVPDATSKAKVIDDERIDIGVADEGRPEEGRSPPPRRTKSGVHPHR